MEKLLLQIQIAFIFQDGIKDSFEKVSLEIKKLLGEPVKTDYPNVPVNAKDSLPRLALAYNGYHITIAKNRLDVFSNNYNLLEVAIDKFYEEFVGKFKLQLRRLGFVRKMFWEMTNDDIKSVFEKKFRAYDMIEVGVRVNIPKKIAGLAVNCVENIQSGNIELTDKAVGKKVTKSGAVIDKDINTISGDMKELNKDDIMMFIQEAEKDSLNILLLPD